MYCEIGRIANDIEVKSAGETKVVNFSLAVDRIYKREGQPETDFVRCAAFGRLAEVIGAHISKGQQLYVVGRLENDYYNDRDGKRRDNWVIKVDSIKFVGKKSSDNSGERDEPEFINYDDYDFSDVPFV